MVICLERGADLHIAQLMPLPLTVSCFSKIQIGFTFLLLAHLGCVCVCVCVLCKVRIKVRYGAGGGECPTRGYTNQHERPMTRSAVQHNRMHYKGRRRQPKASRKWRAIYRVGQKLFIFNTPHPCQRATTTTPV